jgi:hypothetical protein
MYLFLEFPHSVQMKLQLVFDECFFNIESRAPLVSTLPLSFIVDWGLCGCKVRVCKHMVWFFNKHDAQHELFPF